MRSSDVSRPSTSSVPNSGGAFLRPHTATRMGSKHLAGFDAHWATAAARSAASNASCVNSGRGQNLARAFQHAQRHGGIALLGDQLGAS